ncbi:hypothetical protein [Kiloniella antarctica]|uniref:Uncharacterized protein n=1 Tax=Kiloniella antarctica TaxID=1550907 RepID=A0ABW5BJ67_9PROT
MHEFDLYLFSLINATSDTALWLLDWGRFLTWWPQIFAIVSLSFLLLRKNQYGLGWCVKVCATVLLAIGLNQLMSWVLPFVTPLSLGAGHHWMRGAAQNHWGGNYPILLFTVSFVCFFWNQRSYFTGWIFFLALANAWGVIFIGNYFPLQILIALGIGLVASGLVVFIFRGHDYYLHHYKSQIQGRRGKADALTL